MVGRPPESEERRSWSEGFVDVVMTDTLEASQTYLRHLTHLDSRDKDPDSSRTQIKLNLELTTTVHLCPNSCATESVDRLFAAQLGFLLLQPSKLSAPITLLSVKKISTRSTIISSLSVDNIAMEDKQAETPL